VQRGGRGGREGERVILPYVFDSKRGGKVVFLFMYLPLERERVYNLCSKFLCSFLM
jgi:hypothetical protein